MRCCPPCISDDVILHGKDKNRRQRFKCRSCNQTYNTLTGIDLSGVTIWRWRHRFVKAAANNNAAILSGVIETDETFFVRSFKGHRGWIKGNAPEQRAARPRA